MTDNPWRRVLLKKNIPQDNHPWLGSVKISYYSWTSASYWPSLQSKKHLRNCLALPNFCSSLTGLIMFASLCTNSLVVGHNILLSRSLLKITKYMIHMKAEQAIKCTITIRVRVCLKALTMQWAFPHQNFKCYIVST